MVRKKLAARPHHDQGVLPTNFADVKIVKHGIFLKENYPSWDGISFMSVLHKYYHPF